MNTKYGGSVTTTVQLQRDIDHNNDPSTPQITANITLNQQLFFDTIVGEETEVVHIDVSHHDYRDDYMLTKGRVISTCGDYKDATERIIEETLRETEKKLRELLHLDLDTDPDLEKSFVVNPILQQATARVIYAADTLVGHLNSYMEAHPLATETGWDYLKQQIRDYRQQKQVRANIMRDLPLP